MTRSVVLASELPLVAAPMAGGPSTSALAIAVARAGAFPFLAGGYKSVDQLAAEMAEVRAAGATFGVNLFVPNTSTLDATALSAYATELQPEADVYGLKLNPHPLVDDDDWEQKLTLLLREPVSVVSTTFGLPSLAIVHSLQQVGTTVVATVTTLDEARRAQAAGVDGLVVQGSSAGGHSAIFNQSSTPPNVNTAELVRQISKSVDLPIIAAGGVDSPTAVRQLLDAGAIAVAVGTLLLLTDEAGTSATHRAALADPSFAETVITHAFTGRPARALRNGFIDRHNAHAPRGYPAIHYLTRELRQAASKAGNADVVHLWAGTGYRSAPTGQAAKVIDWLAEKL